MRMRFWVFPISGFPSVVTGSLIVSIVAGLCNCDFPKFTITKVISGQFSLIKMAMPFQAVKMMMN